MPPGVVERAVIAVFADATKVLGLPRSLGEIYGLLYVNEQPLALDDLVASLAISKGSASQGLRTLKDLGAVSEVRVPGRRRVHFVAAVDLKRLVGGFIREKVRPHLANGQVHLGRLEEVIDTEGQPERRAFLRERLDRLDRWLKMGGQVLPEVQKLLGA